MKPFDLEAAKRGEPIVCRDGTPAKFIAHVPEADPQERVVYLRNTTICTRAESGIFPAGQGCLDLFMAPKKRTVWVNLYKGGVVGGWWGTESDANFYAGESRLGGRAYPIEIEE